MEKRIRQLLREKNLSAVRLAGMLSIEDPIREDAPMTLAALECDGLRHITMLTGDGEKTASAVARTARSGRLR